MSGRIKNHFSFYHLLRKMRLISLTLSLFVKSFPLYTGPGYAIRWASMNRKLEGVSHLTVLVGGICFLKLQLSMPESKCPVFQKPSFIPRILNKQPQLNFPKIFPWYVVLNESATTLSNSLAFVSVLRICKVSSFHLITIWVFTEMSQIC